MAIVPRETKNGTVYWVVTRGHYERAGKDRREAVRINERRKKEVKAGTFSPSMSSSVGVGTFLKEWIGKRKGRSARVESAYLRNHVFTCDWFMRLRMDDAAPKHVQKLIEEIKDTSDLSHKTISNVFAVLRTAFRAAQRQDLTHRDVCLLDPGTLNVKTAERVPYTVDEVRTLLASATGSRRVWMALAFYTGMRCGEVCGRRWRDWDTKSTPLGCLTIATQYDNLPLKTDSPRRAPVHPALAAILTEWKRTGFEMLHRRKPTADDFIVPRYSSVTGEVTGPISQPSAYWAWGADCKRASVENKTQHATRHTFVTLTQRGGAERSSMEKITHNAKGGVVDNYTHKAWSELCAVVMCLPDFSPTPDGNARRDARSDPETSMNSAGQRSAAAFTNSSNKGKNKKTERVSTSDLQGFLPGKSLAGAALAADQESEAAELVLALREQADHARPTELARALRKTTAPYTARKRSTGGGK